MLEFPYQKILNWNLNVYTEIMNIKYLRWIFYGVLTLTIFSFWAGFALLIVNKSFYRELPGYTIGRICIWELIALIVAGLIAHFMIRNWGSLERIEIDNKIKLMIDQKFGTYFLVYFLIAVGIGIWQFWIFSLKF